jgi:CheY-like chemotaxis protein
MATPESLFTQNLLPMIKQILLVDDDEDEPGIFTSALEETGIPFHCAWVRGAEEALRHLSQQQPDFIVLDFNMPRINGLELLRILKADNMLRNIPVIMYSATMGRELITKALEAGALKCIRKPYSVQELPVILKTILQAGFL